MKIFVKVLYKNGLEDYFITDMDLDKLDSDDGMTVVVADGFTNGKNFCLTFVEPGKFHIVNGQDISRISIENDEDIEGKY